MALLDKIKNDIKEALKSGDRERAEILRFLNAQMQNRAIEKRGQGSGDVLDEEEVMEVLRKEVKRRKEAVDMFNQGGREDLAAKEEKETAVIQDYLPAAPTEQQILEVVQGLKQEGLSGFPIIMKEAMKRLKGADGALVAKIVKAGEE